MSQTKAPAFQFYPKDWISDARVCELSLEEEGAYIRLLSHCWLEGSIPADPERCARIIGKGCSNELATTVQRMFNESSTDSQRLVNKRLDEEREKQLIRREQASEAGRRSGVKRRNAVNSAVKPTNDRSTDVQRKPNTSSASSSPSSTAVVNKEDKAAGAVISANAEILISEISEQVPYEYVRSEFDSTFGRSSRMTDSRRKALAARWRDQWWRDNWQAALQRASSSAFLKGANDRSWVIDLEFFLRPDSVTKILEGKYDNRQQQQRLPISSAAAREQRNADAFAILEAAAAAQIAASGSGGLEDNLNRHQAALCYEEHDGPDTLCSGDMGGGAELF